MKKIIVVALLSSLSIALAAKAKGAELSAIDIGKTIQIPGNEIVCGGGVIQSKNMKSEGIKIYFDFESSDSEVNSMFCQVLAETIRKNNGSLEVKVLQIYPTINLLGEIGFIGRETGRFFDSSNSNKTPVMASDRQRSLDLDCLYQKKLNGDGRTCFFLSDYGLFQKMYMEAVLTDTYATKVPLDAVNVIKMNDER